MRLAQNLFRTITSRRRFATLLPVGHEQNPFKIPVLDVRQFTQTMTSTSGNMECAKNAVSYGHRDLSEFDKTDAEIEKEFPRSTPIQLRYNCTNPLPDGALFLPEAMEDKYVILFKKDKILIIRSWVAQIEAVVYANRIGDKLTLTSVHTRDAAWEHLVVDFIIRSHALRQLAVAPIPAVAVETSKNQEDVLLFSCYGRRVLFAAPAEDVAKIEYDTTPVLRTESATERAMKRGEPLDTIKRLATEAAERGELNVGSSFHSYTLLHGACATANVELVRFLLKLGADRTLSSDQGCTPLMDACTMPTFSPEVADVLLGGAPEGYIESSGGRPDGLNALHIAALSNNLAAAEYLISRGANVNALDKNKFGSLHRAAEMGSSALVKFLLEKGADKTLRSVDSPLKPGGWLPVELAQRRAKQTSQQAEALEIIRLLE